MTSLGVDVGTTNLKVCRVPDGAVRSVRTPDDAEELQAVVRRLVAELSAGQRVDAIGIAGMAETDAPLDMALAALTGTYAMHLTHAQRLGVLDLRSKQWDRELIEYGGLDRLPTGTRSGIDVRRDAGGGRSGRGDAGAVGGPVRLGGWMVRKAQHPVDGLRRTGG